MKLKRIIAVLLVLIALFSMTVSADLSVGEDGAMDDVIFDYELPIVPMPDDSGTEGSGSAGGISGGGSVGGGSAGGGSSSSSSETDETIILPGGAPISSVNTMKFTDVSENNWFYSDVMFVYDKKIMTGTSENAFSPNATLTRAMMITVLHRIAGTPSSAAKNVFDDIQGGSWYEAAVNWGYENKIVSGVGNGKFSPVSNLTREQLCVMLYNYTKYIGRDTEKTDISSFADHSTVSSWASDAMSWAVHEGIITGKGNKTLAPRDGATRAEMAAVIRRYTEKIIENGGK